MRYAPTCVGFNPGINIVDSSLARAIFDVVEAGARVINLRVALVLSAAGETELGQALDLAARKGVIVLAAAGNQGTLVSPIITRHLWVVPAVAYDLHGRLLAISNLGISIGRRGVGAPGEGVTSLRAAGGSLTMVGTSVATPFVTGATALLMCNGLVVPIVAFDQMYSFARDSLLGSIPRPEQMPEDRFREAAREVLDRIMQMADNAGATDEHRALNYLAVRYPAIYAAVAEAHRRNLSLTAVDMRPSLLSGMRKIADVIFSFMNRATDVVEKQFLRCDITEEFPFLVTKMSRYFDQSVRFASASRPALVEGEECGACGVQSRLELCVVEGNVGALIVATERAVKVKDCCAVLTENATQRIRSVVIQWLERCAGGQAYTA